MRKNAKNLEVRAMKRIYHRDALKCVFDVDEALDILENYKEEELENELSEIPIALRKDEISRKKYAINCLEEWIVDKAFEAPVVNNIESFIFAMNSHAALYAEDTYGYQLFCTMRDMADKLIGYFL